MRGCTSGLIQYDDSLYQNKQDLAVNILLSYTEKTLRKVDDLTKTGFSHESGISITPVVARKKFLKLKEELDFDFLTIEDNRLFNRKVYEFKIKLNDENKTILNVRPVPIGYLFTLDDKVDADDLNYALKS